jgi:hypothetical protein
LQGQATRKGLATARRVAGGAIAYFGKVGTALHLLFRGFLSINLANSPMKYSTTSY